jgi:hypothetical protein
MNFYKAASLIISLFIFTFAFCQNNEAQTLIKQDSTNLLSEPGVYYGAIITKDVKKQIHITIACENSPHITRNILNVTQLIPSDWQTFEATLTKTADGSLNYTADKTEGGIKTLHKQELGIFSVSSGISISNIKKACISSDSAQTEVFTEIEIQKVYTGPKIKLNAAFNGNNLTISVLNKVMLDYKTVAQLFNNNGKLLNTIEIKALETEINNLIIPAGNYVLTVQSGISTESIDIKKQ